MASLKIVVFLQLIIVILFHVRTYYMDILSFSCSIKEIPQNKVLKMKSAVTLTLFFSKTL